MFLFSAGMVTAMDQAIGKIVSALVRRKMMKNTLIIFLSDVRINETGITKLSSPIGINVAVGPGRECISAHFKFACFVVYFQINWVNRFLCNITLLLIVHYISLL